MKNLARDIYEYFNETTVHGFHYIVTGRNWVERFFWASLIICGFVLSRLGLGSLPDRYGVAHTFVNLPLKGSYLLSVDERSEPVTALRLG